MKFKKLSECVIGFVNVTHCYRVARWRLLGDENAAAG